LKRRERSQRSDSGTSDLFGICVASDMETLLAS
jgi:hypothetical protein